MKYIRVYFRDCHGPVVRAGPGQDDLKIVMGRAEYFENVMVGPDRTDNFEIMMGRTGPGRKTWKM